MFHRVTYHARMCVNIHALYGDTEVDEYTAVLRAFEIGSCQDAFQKRVMTCDMVYAKGRGQK